MPLSKIRHENLGANRGHEADFVGQDFDRVTKQAGFQSSEQSSTDGFKASDNRQGVEVAHWGNVQLITETIYAV
jgi:hypothetical protein